ncbi:uncharacterized protein I206_104322 [Kwoniella pini CBS 10737]|uniref:Chromo domain-containing protein n=1 Tax=Kwoniella pini CBS 10737 TaxID=1296096 RepID=A0A1B9I294_9TREE|nr:uncharacterized protein I206_04100 [Kwoniella pini CBS 10737]OCF49578.1 hypothetical protein I206_04100 [Kwoniella pini CBS 10737]
MRPKREREDSATPPAETQFISQSDDSDNLWEALEIIGERGPRRTGDYLVQWKGVDPSTKGPWEPSWTKKEGCTQDLVRDWKVKCNEAAEKEKDNSERGKNTKKRKMTREEKKTTSPEVVIPAHRGRGRPPGSTKSNKSSATLHNRRTSRGASFSSEYTTTSAPSPTKTSRVTRGQNKNPPQTHIVEIQDESSSSPASSDKPSSRISKVRIDLTNTESAIAGPGPSTAANRSRQSTPTDTPPLKTTSKSRSRVSLKSPGNKQSEQPVEPGLASLADADNSSVSGDSIGQFSTPPASERRPKAATVEINPAANLLGESSNDQESASAPQEVKDVATANVWETIEHDGEIGERLVGEDDEGLAVIRVMEEDSMEQEIGEGDEDLNDLDSEHGNGEQEPLDQGQDITDENRGGSDNLAESDGLANLPAEVAADESIISIRQTGNDDDNSLKPHPDTVALQESRAKIAELEAQISQLHQPEDHPDTVALHESRSKIAQLEAQLSQAQKPEPHPDSILLDEFRSRVAQLEIERQAALSVSTEPPTTQAEAGRESISEPRITQLEDEIAKLKRSKDLLSDDNGFLRGQYAEASSRAVTEVNNVKTLTEQVQTLKSQLSTGLKQRHMLFEKIAKDKEIEVHKLKGQLKILLDQSRLTDDNVRAKAAAYSTMKGELEEMTRQFLARGGEIDRLNRRIESLSERNEELVDQLDTIRALKMGVLPGLAEEEDRDSYSSAGESDSTDDSLILKARNSEKKRNGIERLSTNDVFQAQYIQGENTKTPLTGYECKFHDGEKGCNVICETVEVGETETNT